MNTCKSCIHWKLIKHRYTIRDGKHVLGFCRSDKWNVHPEYYICSDRETKADMAEVTYDPIVGKDFGCIHHTPNP